MMGVGIRGVGVARARGFNPATLFQGGTVAGAWYDPSDLSTMFDSSAGTTPVAMPGQGAAVPVGLMLDKSQGLVLGPQTELVTNGTFNTDIAGWTFTGGGGSAAWNAGTARITGTSSVSKQFSQGISVVAGKSYTITGTVTPVSGTLSASLTLRTTNDVATSAFIAGQSFSASGGTVNFKYVAPTTTTVFVCIQSFATISTFDIDNISIVEWIQGNHAIAANDSTKRPVLMARVNLLTYSEEFDNAAWVKAPTSSAAGTTAVNDPIGGLTADLYSQTAGSPFISQNVTLSSATSLTASCYFRKNVGDFVNFFCADTATTSNGFRCFLDLSTGQKGTEGTVGSGATFTGASVQDAGNGWYRLSITGQVGAATTAITLGFYVTVTDNTNTRLIPGSVYVWGADLRPANIGANVPAYQRIADALTYDTSGFPLYLYFDGADDSMYTPANLNLSGTDKVAVFAGGRKLSSSVNFYSELTTNAFTLAGGFYISGFLNTYAFVNQGSFYEPSGYVSPISNVLACSYDLSKTTLATEIIPRIDGVVTQTGGFGSGSATGNFANAPLFIGARNNASFFLNGHLHSLIIAGSAVSAGNISATEQWVAQKTGLALP